MSNTIVLGGKSEDHFINIDASIGNVDFWYNIFANPSTYHDAKNKHSGVLDLIHILYIQFNVFKEFFSLLFNGI